MNAAQKRKAKKIAYRKFMRKKIKLIKHVCSDGMFGDEIAGFDCLGRYYCHLTNFQQWQRKTYQVALMSYPGNRGQFGLSDTTIIVNYEEGWSQPAPGMGALFVSGPWEDLNDFWRHFDRVNNELTRYTRRERQRNPKLIKIDEWQTFRRPRA